MADAEEVSFSPSMEYKERDTMSQEREPEIFREIEEEVQKILKQEEGRRREKTAVIHYFSLKRGNGILGEILQAAREGNVVLVSFENPDLEGVKEDVSKLAQKIGEMGGKAYFIKWPTLLLMNKDMQLKVHR